MPDKPPPPPLPGKAAAPVKQTATRPLVAARKRWVWTDHRITTAFVAGGMVLGGLAAVGVSSLVQGRDNGSDITAQAEILHIIKDSVDPGGKRFQRGQAQTAAAVSSINEISVLAAHCAHKHQDLVAIQVCVQIEYQRMHPTTTTTPPEEQDG